MLNSEMGTKPKGLWLQRAQPLVIAHGGHDRDLDPRGRKEEQEEGQEERVSEEGWGEVSA